MAIIDPEIRQLLPKYQGKIATHILVELSAGDSMFPFFIDPYTYEVRVHFKPSAGGSGVVVQSYQSKETDISLLEWVNWDYGDTGSECVDSLIPGNWLSVFCSAGTLKAEFIVWG